MVIFSIVSTYMLVSYFAGIRYEAEQAMCAESLDFLKERQNFLFSELNTNYLIVIDVLYEKNPTNQLIIEMKRDADAMVTESSEITERVNTILRVMRGVK